MPAMGASSWMPALLTMIWIGCSAIRVSTACRLAAASATSKTIARAWPPLSRIRDATASARSLWPCACTISS